MGSADVMIGTTAGTEPTIWLDRRRADDWGREWAQVSARWTRPQR